MQVYKTIIITITLFIPITQASNHYCGPNKIGLITKVTPQTFGSALVYRACEHHDNCYNQCGISKRYCDEAFKEDMINICYNTYGINLHTSKKYLACLAGAESYFEAVVNLGVIPFKQSQKAHC